ncbi:hypothetical protein SAMN05421806_11993 [Streptomyces indicus]|uniref:Uncharacterized protein n=1 Tax=Streptomyces indicus TaxID=417292 RepID=A0A1G9HMG2_9ACTN|nr:hypothetical protein SAMN05421806_11993 [Streptomyces indicus]
MQRQARDILVIIWLSHHNDHEPPYLHCYPPLPAPIANQPCVRGS